MPTTGKVLIGCALGLLAVTFAAILYLVLHQCCEDKRSNDEKRKHSEHLHSIELQNVVHEDYEARRGIS
ncbi:hypothetical protein NHE_0096 [Neorickettsia helminthoeca str. Oregon]|uniref:Uncharacterized protein n=1 Tax=Neorickettsia helminthoeca str. Oregon TaxID=1286528 RepID=X5H3E3_9RICK|nr:hypothetical protein NHE_0096 [Neorickettsia helminthoeca str. Oregon]